MIQSLFFLPLSILLMSVSYLQAAATGTAASPAPPAKAAEVPAETLIRDNFGPHVTVAGGAKPTVLKGDFNGDRIPDLAVLVQPKGKRGELSPGVIMVHTAEGVRDPAPTVELSGKNSLAVIHGSATGLKSPSGKYLIYAFGWIGWNGPETGNLLVLPKSSKRDKAGYATVSPENYVSMPNDNKGDVILVPTEAGINTLLYWNGKTYRFWLDPGDTP